MNSEILERPRRLPPDRLRFALTRESARYLDWRLDELHREAAAARAAGAALRDQPVAIPTGVELPQSRVEPVAEVRRFRARDSCEWLVREIEVAGEPWARAPRCLVFHSRAFARRVWRYPADWRSLSDTALERLSWAV